MLIFACKHLQGPLQISFAFEVICKVSKQNAKPKKMPIPRTFAKLTWHTLFCQTQSPLHKCQVGRKICKVCTNAKLIYKTIGALFLWFFANYQMQN